MVLEYTDQGKLMLHRQLHLNEKKHKSLQKIAHDKGTSISAIVRGILHDQLIVSPRTETRSIEVFTFISSGASRYHDISECHNEALIEDFK